MGKKTREKEGSAAAVSPDDATTAGASEQEVDEAMLQRQVRSYLAKLKKGDLYMDGIGGEEFENLLDAEGNPPSESDKKHVFIRLLRVVAKGIVESQKGQLANGSSSSSKKRQKIVRQQLWSRRDKWVEDILNFDQNIEQNIDENNDAMEVEQQQEATKPVSPEEDLETNGAVGPSASPKKKKKKKKKSEKKKKKEKPVKNSDDMDVDDVEDELVDDDPTDIPKSKSNKKKKLGSGKKSKKIKTEKVAKEPAARKRPPSASKRRQELKEKFEAEKEEILSSLPDDITSQFRQVGFAKWGKAFLPVLYLGPYDVSPGPVRDQWMQMYRNTAGRRHMMTRLVYWYGTENIIEAYSFQPKNSCLSYEEGVDKGCDQIPKIIQKKMDAGKKLTKSDRLRVNGLKEMKEDLEKDLQDRQRGPEFVEDHEDVESDEMESDEESVVYDQIDVDEPMAEEAIEDAEGERPPVAKQKKNAPVKTASQEDELKYLEADISSEEEDEAADIPESGEDDDEGDLDFSPETKTKKKTGKRKSDGQSSKSTEKPEKKAKLDRKRTKKPAKLSKKAAYQQEQMRFEECESNYLPMVGRWKSSLKTKDVDKLLGVMDELNDSVESFSAAFIEAYGLAQLMKDAKPLLKSSDVHSSKYKEVWNKMKKTYEEKKALKPLGFDPIKRSRTTKAPKSTGNESPSRKTEEQKVAQSPEPDKETKTTEPIEQNGSEEAKIESAEGTTIASPMRIPRTKDHNEAVLASPPMSRESSQNLLTSTSQTAIRPNQVKSEKKLFSLSQITGMRPKPTGSQGASAEQVGRASATKPTADSSDIPFWLTKAPEVDTSNMDEERTFALEFLEQAAVQFPAEKVDREAVARSLEDAVFRWSKENNRAKWVEPYWEKVHALVGAICGKRKTGQIVSSILDGKYKTASELVVAPEETLRWSFGI